MRLGSSSFCCCFPTPLLPTAEQHRRSVKARTTLSYEPGRFPLWGITWRTSLGSERLIPISPDVGNSDQADREFPRTSYHPIYHFQSRSAIHFSQNFQPTLGTPGHRLQQQSGEFNGVIAPAILVGKDAWSIPAFGSSHQLTPIVDCEVQPLAEFMRLCLRHYFVTWSSA